MNEVVETRASAQPTAAGNNDPADDSRDAAARSVESNDDEASTDRIDDLKQRTHPFLGDD
ncbi:MAG: hypothetical protein ACR2JZ_00145 [Candidatus Limnocylindrales bacterium]